MEVGGFKLFKNAKLSDGVKHDKAPSLQLEYNTIFIHKAVCSLTLSMKRKTKVGLALYSNNEQRTGSSFIIRITNNEQRTGSLFVILCSLFVELYSNIQPA